MQQQARAVIGIEVCAGHSRAGFVREGLMEQVWDWVVFS